MNNLDGWIFLAFLACFLRFIEKVSDVIAKLSLWPSQHSSVKLPTLQSSF